MKVCYRIRRWSHDTYICMCICLHVCMYEHSTLPYIKDSSFYPSACFSEKFFLFFFFIKVYTIYFFFFLKRTVTANHRIHSRQCHMCHFFFFFLVRTTTYEMTRCTKKWRACNEEIVTKNQKQIANHRRPEKKRNLLRVILRDGATNLTLSSAFH